MGTIAGKALNHMIFFNGWKNRQRSPRRKTTRSDGFGSSGGSFRGFSPRGWLILPSVLLLGMFLTGCLAPKITADPIYFPPPPASAHVVHLKSFNRLHDLIDVRPSLADLFHGGSISPQIAKPAGIAYGNGHLYICDTDLNTVHDWNLSTGTGRRIGAKGDGTLAKPVAVAVDDRGTLYVADTKRAEVLSFDAEGRLLSHIKPPDRKPYRPVAVAVHESTLYVADIIAQKIDLFSTADGRHLEGFGTIGTAPGQFYYPMGLALDTGGRLYLSDMMNARVQVFDPEHHPLLSMGQPGDRYGDMGKPRQVAVGPDGIIFIADPEFAHVHLFNSRGQLLMLLGGPEDRPGGTPLPIGVAVAKFLPEPITALVPSDFQADYYLFVSNTIGRRRLSLFAVGRSAGQIAIDGQ